MSVHICFVLDQSGSMGAALPGKGGKTVADETIEGFNLFVEEQKRGPGNAYLSLTLFDTGVLRRYEGAALSVIPPMDKTGFNAYQPSGGTALYDAVVDSIVATAEWVKANSFKDLVIVAIMTDGGENSSNRHSLAELNDLIREKKNQGWQFVFLGSGSAAWTEGRNLDVDPALVLNYQGQNTNGVYAGLSGALTMTRRTGSPLVQSFAATTAQFQADDDENRVSGP